MQKTALALMLISALLFLNISSRAQATTSKLGCISLSELLNAMPEFKKADTTLARYRDTLQQKFDALKTEYTQQASALSSPDTAKFTQTQLVLKKQTLSELLAKIQGFDAEAGQLLNQRR